MNAPINKDLIAANSDRCAQPPSERVEALKKAVQSETNGACIERALLWTEYDKDKDGKLSRAEFNAGLMEVAEKARDAMPQFEDYDTSKDGRISEAEFNDARAKRQETQGNGGRRRGGGMSFADMDTNKDGGVTKDEFEAYRKKMVERLQERRERNGDV